MILENNTTKYRTKLSMRAIYSHFHTKNTLIKCTVSNFTRLIRSFSIIDNGEMLLTLSDAYIIDPMFFILGGDEDSHNISDEFEYQSDRITNCGDSCPLH